MDHPSLTGAVWESIIKTVETWRGWKTQVSVPLDSKQHVHVVWVYSVYRSLVSFSDTVSAAQAHAAKCSGFSERVAQNSARHCLLHCWCEHLHCEFTAFLALLFFNFKSSSSFYKLLLHSQHTLLAFTVSGIFKEGELCSSRLSSCSIQLNWLLLSSVFQLLLMQSPVSPPWRSLEYSLQSQLETLGRFSKWAKNDCCHSAETVT